MIAVTVSEMLLASNRNTLPGCFRVDSLSIMEGHEVIYKLPDLRELLVVVERHFVALQLALPSLADLTSRTTMAATGCGRSAE